ncbi:MAG: AbrB/MazE/SpoVT family DNA-binding domain-containing protein [Candidatus Brocadiia bacterium]
MLKNLTKHGNSYALVIDKPILKLLDIDLQTPIEITTDGSIIVLSPVRDEDREKKFEGALEDTNRRFRDVLKKLAD